MSFVPKIIALGLIGIAVACPVSATNPGVLVVMDPQTSGRQLCAGSITACSEWSSSVPVNQTYYAYVVVARGHETAGIASVSLGAIAGAGLHVGAWNLCASSQDASASWPEDGSGIRVSWDANNCQQVARGDDGVHAVAGFIYLYAYADTFYEISENTTVDPVEFEVTDCSGVVSPLVSGMRLGFGSVLGSNPCSTDVPVEPSNWGQIKALYR